MRSVSSIKNSILVTVISSLALLAVVTTFTLSFYEAEKLRENTYSLIHEQIDLTVKKLDRFSVYDQVSFISKTIYHLKKVNGVVIFDSNCTKINKIPINYNIDWDCKGELQDNIVVYTAESSISSSDGAPKFILARVKVDKSLFSDYSILKVLLTSIFLILITIVALQYLFRRKILKPIELLENIISRSGVIERDSSAKKTLPVELHNIYEDVLARDEIIQQNKKELLKQSEAQIKLETSQQLAHDILSPLGIVRDDLLKRIGDSSEKDELNESKSSKYEKIVLNAFDDIEVSISQLLERSFDSKQEINISVLVQEIVDQKLLEFKNSKPSIEIALKDTTKEAKANLNPTKFKFMLSNIINNAKEASSRKKVCKITIEISEREGNVIVAVEDNGKGIRKEDIEKIFERGVSIRKPGGSGLGLYDAKIFLNTLKGNISIGSRHGKSTKVTISIPCSSHSFQSHGSGPYENVLIEDYQLSQLIWMEEAIDKNINFITFSSPTSFLENRSIIKKGANIFLDSHFPDFEQKGEEWAKSVFELGFENIYMCSSSIIEIDDKEWIKGKGNKNKPFYIES